jgi:hypothetical protein
MVNVEIVTSPSIRWRFTTRLAFRFFVAYLGLYLTPIIPASLVSWVAASVFRVGAPLVLTMTGSGDRTVDWVRAFCVLVGAIVVTAIWSILDRERLHYRRLHQWVRLFVRFALGAVMVNYGMLKVIPVQMPAPTLVRLLEPFGHFSPMGVLWSFVGASSSYERLAGGAELLGGLLLFWPRTALIGALVCLIVTSQIFVLNMTYDVSVKLFSFHLILLSVFLVAPDARRLADALLFTPSAESSSPSVFARTPRRRQGWLVAQIGLGALIVVGAFVSARQMWMQVGGAPRSPLYGVWDVIEMSIDGVARPPLVTDTQRWRRVVFELPSDVAFQRMDDTFAFRRATIDMAERSLALTGGSGGAVSTLSFERLAPDVLVLDGEMDGHRVVMRLESVDHGKLRLVKDRFHWVQEYPLNR